MNGQVDLSGPGNVYVVGQRSNMIQNSCEGHQGAISGEKFCFLKRKFLIIYQFFRT